MKLITSHKVDLRIKTAKLTEFFCLFFPDKNARKRQFSNQNNDPLFSHICFKFTVVSYLKKQANEQTLRKNRKTAIYRLFLTTKETQ